MKKKSALLICNGEPPGKKLAQALARKADYIIAADGGANVARALGIWPDVIIGDLDSVEGSTLKSYARGKRRGYTKSRMHPGGVDLIRISRQDKTDLEKALDFLLASDFTEVILLAATGHRLDHTLGNLSVVWNYVGAVKVMIVADDWCGIPMRGGARVKAPLQTTVSLIPFGRCSGITLKGLHYPLTNATMRVGEIGVSNLVTSSPFHVEVKNGAILMFMMCRYTKVEVRRLTTKG